MSPNAQLQNENIIADKKEVLKQLKKIKELNDLIDCELESMVDDFVEHWEYLHNKQKTLTIRGRISIRTFLKSFPVHKIIEAADIAFTQSSDRTDTFKYMCGILQNWKKGIVNKPENSYE